MGAYLQLSIMPMNSSRGVSYVFLYSFYNICLIDNDIGSGLADYGNGTGLYWFFCEWGGYWWGGGRVAGLWWDLLGEVVEVEVKWWCVGGGWGLID